MKKQLLSVIAASSVMTAFAQLPVSTAPQNKKAVLEEFTGIYCGYCPDGHRIATNIYNADPNNVILVNIHSGGFANVAAGEPDLKTPEGTAIDGMTGTSTAGSSIAMGITGYPAGTVNRRAFTTPAPQTAGGMAGGRGSWTAWSAAVKTETAYLNVAVQGQIDVTTRLLTATVEVYYTGTSPSATNQVNVFLLEDDVNGPQHNYGAPSFGPGYYNYANYNADESYNHKHVLRKALTGNFGMPITTTTAGAMYTQTLSYAIPQTYGAAGKTNPCQLGNLHLVAFVTETDINTINGAKGPIALTNFQNTLDVGTNSLKSENTVCASTDLNPSVKFMNYGSAAATSVVFSYAVNGGAASTYSWTGNVNPQTGSQNIDLPMISFVPVTAGSNTLTVNVLSVNGGNDANAANNISTKLVGLPVTANNPTITVNFNQDRYGDESSWAVYDEVTGDSLAWDGPFAQLAANGTLLHSQTFTVEPTTCFKVVVRDAYGDGINAGFGAGNYNVKSGNITIITSNGQFGAGETKLFKSGAAPVVTGFANLKTNVRGAEVYPNPASNATNLSLELIQNETLSVNVVNSIGQEVYSIKSKNFDAGKTELSLNTENWASGVYFISISSPQGTMNKKLTVSK